jgi:hypothetical protein
MICTRVLDPPKPDPAVRNRQGGLGCWCTRRSSRRVIPDPMAASHHGGMPSSGSQSRKDQVPPPPDMTAVNVGRFPAPAAAARGQRASSSPFGAFMRPSQKSHKSAPGGGPHRLPTD